MRVVENEAFSLDLNGQVIVKDQFWFGLTVRDKSAAGFNFQYHEFGMRFGYAYEVPFNKLATSSYGTHELMFALDFEMLKGHKKVVREY